MPLGRPGSSAVVEPVRSGAEPAISPNDVADNPSSTAFTDIVDKIAELGSKNDADLWAIGRLAAEAAALGVASIKTGSDQILRAVAEAQPYFSFETLRRYRRTYLAWLDDDGNLAPVAGVSFTAHKAVGTRHDRRDAGATTSSTAFWLDNRGWVFIQDPVQI